MWLNWKHYWTATFNEQQDITNLNSFVPTMMCIHTCTCEDRPQLHKLDNELSHDVEAFIIKNNASFQYTPIKIHQTNITECAM